MIIKITATGLKQTQWHEYVVRFAAGGLVTAAAGLIAEKWGPEIGGLFLAFPAIFPAAITFIANHEREKKAEQGMEGNQRAIYAAALASVGTTMGSVGLITFAFISAVLLPAHSPLLVLVMSTAGWLLASGLIWLGWRARHRLCSLGESSPPFPP